MPDDGPNEWALMPWLLMASGCAVDVWEGDVAHRWLAAAGLVLFVGCYVAVVFVGASSAPSRRRTSMRLLLPMAALAIALGGGYGGTWLSLFSLLSLVTGVAVRGRSALTALLGVVVIGMLSAMYGGHPDQVMTVAYSSLLSGAVVSIILRQVSAVHALHNSRGALARSAVEQERLRFSRDLHDLLGHTMSVIVVKAEAVRRLAPRDLDAALAQAADIEAVGRQALTEIREAVTGYREGSLATELDRARSLLGASCIEAVVRQSGPPLPPQVEALLGWVIREGVTNTVRHSGATRCKIELNAGIDRVRLDIVDNGDTQATATGGGGTGLTGLTERLAAAGGALRSGPAGKRGFRLTVELPIDAVREAYEAHGPNDPVYPDYPASPAHPFSADRPGGAGATAPGSARQ
nr:histidine kinase [Streptomyces zagrosensis]